MYKVLVVGVVKKRVIDDEVFKAIGYVKADTIRSRRVYVIGFIEVHRSIRSDELFVNGCIRARSISSRKTIILSKTQSSIIDIESKYTILRGVYGGKIGISYLKTGSAILEWTYIHNIYADRVKAYSGVVFENIDYIGELVIRDPYMSIRLENIGKVKHFTFQYSTYEYTSSQKQSSPSDQLV